MKKLYLLILTVASGYFCSINTQKKKDNILDIIKILIDNGESISKLKSQFNTPEQLKFIDEYSQLKKNQKK